MIRFDNVSFWYSKGKTVLKDFSMTVKKGERIFLSGRSGSGKSTVLRLLMGLEKPRRGRVELPAEMRMAAVFQEDRLIPWKTVFENVSLFADGPEDGAGRDEKVKALLGDLGLKDASGMLPEELSGGMKRRAALARALARKSDLLVLDEAYTGLDEPTLETCLAVTQREAEGRTLLIATHNPREAAFFGAREVRVD